MTNGGIYRLHSQNIQALAENLVANVATARALRQQQVAQGVTITARYPYKPKPFQTVTWKDRAIAVVGEPSFSPMDAGRPLWSSRCPNATMIRPSVRWNSSGASIIMNLR